MATTVYSKSDLINMALNQLIDKKLDNPRHYGCMVKIVKDITSSRTNITPQRMLMRIIDIEIIFTEVYSVINVQPYFNIVVQPVANYECWVLMKSVPNKRLHVYAFCDITNVDLMEAKFLWKMRRDKIRVVKTNRYAMKGEKLCARIKCSNHYKWL